MTDYFKIASGIARTAAKLAVDPLSREEWVNPPMHPDEKKWIESQVGKPLTDTEAKALLREAMLWASFDDGGSETMSFDEDIERRANQFVTEPDDLCRNCGHDFFDHVIDAHFRTMECEAAVIRDEDMSVEFCGCSKFDLMTPTDIQEDENAE